MSTDTVLPGPPAAAEPAPPVPAAAPAACLNCGAALPAPPPRYCPDCGQETNLRPPTLGEFLQQFGGAYFATEGALWRTLKLLLLRPGELTRQYLAGRRRHYVLPLRIYLSISLVVLLALRIAAGWNIDEALQVDIGDRKASVTALDFGSARVGLKDGVFFCEGLPAWLCKRFQRRLDVDPKALLAQIPQLGERVVANLGAAMFVMLPAFALWLKLLYLNRRLRYTEHLVFALHVHAFWFVALALTAFGPGWVGTVTTFAVPGYTLLAMRRVYGGRWWPLLLRAGVISALYGLLLLVVSAAVVLWSWLA